MLALKRRDGVVYASVPGLASRANVPLADTQAALKCFMTPDPFSRTKEHEGRRIEEVDGGWLVLNASKFDKIRSIEERREYMKNFMADKRAAEKLAIVSNVSPNSSSSTTSSKEDQEHGKKAASSTDDPPPCPVAQIVELYHEVLPELPECRKITPGRRSAIQQRWREDLTDLDDWRMFFSDYVRPSGFLMGRSAGTNGRPVFRADIGWLTNPTNYAKIIEGKYSG